MKFGGRLAGQSFGLGCRGFGAQPHFVVNAVVVVLGPIVREIVKEAVVETTVLGKRGSL